MYDPNKDFFINQSTDQKTLPERYHITQVALFASGIFAGATVRLEVSPDEYIPGETDPDEMKWFTNPEGIYTEEVWNNADLAELWVRATLSDASEDTLVSFKMRPRLSVGN